MVEAKMEAVRLNKGEDEEGREWFETERLSTVAIARTFSSEIDPRDRMAAPKKKRVALSFLPSSFRLSLSTT